MKSLDKYLLFIISGFLLISGGTLLAHANYYFVFSTLGVIIILIIVYERKLIKDFFTISKVKSLDDYMIFAIYILWVLMYVIHSFFDDINKNYYLSDIILIVAFTLVILKKRLFFKKLFKIGSMQKNKEHSESDKKEKLFTKQRTLYIIMLVFTLFFVLFVVNRFFIKDLINEKVFEYLNISIFIIMVILTTIYEYKKKSIEKE